LPIYREVFGLNELKGRADKFIEGLSSCIPAEKKVLLIMDAGFGDEWFDAVSNKNWYWLVRARGKKFIKLSDASDWVDARECYDLAEVRAKEYKNAYITKNSQRPCRIILKASTSESISKRKRPEKLPRNYNSANGNYQKSNKEPWVLATNLPDSHNTTKIVNYYKKRMQIEESFRDIKSHQFGLSARYIRSVSVYRWSVAMLLAAIVQVTLWLIGVIGHHQGMQSYFQANTVKDKKVFSYFFLGQLIVEHGKLEEVMCNCKNIALAVEEELAKVW
jgi:hypothetical protein